MNNLDPEVAEDPDDLVVYGGTGRAARSWEAFDAIVRELRRLADDETLLVQSGKPVGVFRTHEWAPRVLIANSNLVGKWANWDTFRELERQGLTMYGQMTAGSWIYIGTQGILQGTYETFAELARQHFGGTLRGRVALTAGLGGMGGAQPLAVTMNEGVCIAIEVDEARARRRLEIGYVDRLTDDPAEALAMARACGGRGPGALDRAGRQRRGDRARVGGRGRAVRRRHRPDVRPRRARRLRAGGDRPRGRRRPARRRIRTEYAAPVDGVDGRPRPRDARLPAGRRRSSSTTATTSAPRRRTPASRTPSTSRASCPRSSGPLFCEGKGPFRWAALSGDPADILRTDRAILELFPDDAGLRRWIEMAEARVPFQGLPARICWLGYGERAKAGSRVQRPRAAGEVSAPIVIGRDHLDAGSVASPNRETEAMLDGSDAIADWPLLNALVNTAAGATWVSIHHGGGVGIGYSQHAGMVVVADGTELAAQKLERVLTTDPGMGVLRHVDAGYERAIEVARERGVRIPMLEA